MSKTNQGFSSLILLSAIGGSLIASALLVSFAQASKPGDALYSVDRGAENLQLALAFTDGMKKEINASIAKERLIEMEALYSETDANPSDIEELKSNYEKHKLELDDLINSDGTVDQDEQELEDSVSNKESEIDRIAESKQKVLETQRETLQIKYESAKASGDTGLVTKTEAQIQSLNNLLKDNEVNREEQKQEQERQSELEKDAAELKTEAEKQAAELKAEAEKNNSESEARQ